MSALDPLVSLTPPQIDVDLGDWTYTIPALPAADWLVAVLSPNGGAIVPGLLRVQDRRDIWADYAAGAWSEEELLEVEREALAAASGRPWWEADRLIRSAFSSDSWPIVSGEMIHRGIDVHTISLAGWLNWIFVLVISRCKDDAERSKFEAQLRAIPAGVTPEQLAESEEDMAAAFMAAMGEQETIFAG
jgi:hypothetical protein